MSTERKLPLHRGVGCRKRTARWAKHVRLSSFNTRHNYKIILMFSHTQCCGKVLRLHKNTVVASTTLCLSLAHLSRSVSVPAVIVYICFSTATEGQRREILQKVAQRFLFYCSVASFWSVYVHRCKVYAKM